MSLPQDVTGFAVVCEKCGRKTSFEDGSLIAVRQPPAPRDPNAPLPEPEVISFADLDLEDLAKSYVRHREERLLAATDGDRWMVACAACSTAWVYWIDLKDLFGGGGTTIRWIHHVCEKTWFHPASFIAAVARLCDQLYAENARRAVAERTPGGAA